MKIPENLQVFATHGSYSVPPELERYIRQEFGERLRRNFSDFATRDLLLDVPDDQKLVPLHGRIGIDPARALTAPDISRETDFNGIPIFRIPLPEDVKRRVTAASYEPYHRALLDRMLGAHGDPRKTLVAVDLHDTGNLMLGTNEDDDRLRSEVQGWKMPPIIISNNPGPNQSASDSFMSALQDALKTQFNLGSDDVQINRHFLGGHVTKHYGDRSTPALARAAHENRVVVQVELDRGLYLEEKTQTPIPTSMNWVRERLVRAVSEVAGDTAKS